jgi:hypothetical protein
MMPLHGSLPLNDSSAWGKNSSVTGRRTHMVMTGRLSTQDRIAGDRLSGKESRPTVIVGCS